MSRMCPNFKLTVEAFGDKLCIEMTEHKPGEKTHVSVRLLDTLDNDRDLIGTVYPVMTLPPLAFAIDWVMKQFGERESMRLYDALSAEYPEVHRNFLERLRNGQPTGQTGGDSGAASSPPEED